MKYKEESLPDYVLDTNFPERILFLGNRKKGRPVYAFFHYYDKYRGEAVYINSRTGKMVGIMPIVLRNSIFIKKL